MLKETSKDLADIERLTWMEIRFGITKTVGTNPSSDKIEAIEDELFTILSKYREKLKIANPVPKIKMWLTNDKLNFMFYDRKTGDRVILGDWLSSLSPETYKIKPVSKLDQIDG